MEQTHDGTGTTERAMTVTEFLEARIAEDEAVARVALDDQRSVPAGATIFHVSALDLISRYNPVRVLAECAAKRAVIEQHKGWPVLVEKKPSFSETAGDLMSMAYRVSQEMAWLTEREYVKRFGMEAPTTNMIRALAAIYADHPDYEQGWAL